MEGYFLAIGELLADVVTTNYCDTLEHAKGFTMLPGGSPANVAANLLHLGGCARLVSCIGDDSLGRFLLAHLKRVGIDTATIQVAGSEPTSIVFVSRSTGTPDFIAFRHADACIQPPDAALLRGSAVVHSTSFALSRQPARSSIMNAMERAHFSGKTVSVDWNFAPNLWSDISTAKSIFENIIALSPILKASTDDIERFTGAASTIESCRDFLGQYQTKVTCLTCGKDGVWFREGVGEWQFLPAVAVPQVVDVTGAGDAFWAGFVIRFMEESGIEICVQHGLDVAARKIQKAGPLYD